MISQGRPSEERLYVENVENSIEFRSPSGNSVSVVPRTDKSRDGAALTVLDDLSLDLRDSSATKGFVSKPPECALLVSTLNLPRQLIYCLAYGLTEVAQSLPVHSPIERSAYIGAG